MFRKDVIRKLRNISMFARLYIGIVTGMIATIYLFLSLGEGHMRRTEIETFLNDGTYFVEQYIHQRNHPTSLYRELDKTGYQQFYIFNLRLIENWDSQAPLLGLHSLHDTKWCADLPQ